MESGVIQSPHEIAWTRKKRRYPHNTRLFPLPEGSVVLADRSWAGSTVEAYYCCDCRKIVIDPTGGSAF